LLQRIIVRRKQRVTLGSIRTKSLSHRRVGSVWEKAGDGDHRCNACHRGEVALCQNGGEIFRGHEDPVDLCDEDIVEH